MDASLDLEDFFSKARIPPYNLTFKRLNSRSLWSSFGWSTIRNYSVGLALNIGTFQKVQHEVIYFRYVARKNEKLP